jgi:digeranylgeranylglycerophospholipid reductase
MVVVDQGRCAYCGGCVSVCPVEALTLAETRLVVHERCIDCGDCVSACPVGALRPEGGSAFAPGPLSRRRADLVVVGAGPGGSTAAWTAARAGLSVLLLEKRQEIGSPVRCAEGIGHDQLVRFLEPDPHWISAEVSRASITAVHDGESRTLEASGGRGYVLERRVFDRALAERAAAAGAEVRVKTAVTGLLVEDGRVCGVTVDGGDFYAGTGPVEIETGVVIAADGVEAQVGRWAGLDLQLPLHDTMACVQYLLAGVDVDPACTCYTIDEAIAPGGYAWVFPKGEGRANVGLGVQADLWERADMAASGAGRPRVLDLLDRFVAADPALARGAPVTLVAGAVPVGPVASPLVADGLLIVGDAARQVDPLTGGGIANAVAAGQLAAQVAIQAVAAGDTSAGFLWRYQESWTASHGRQLDRNYRLRTKFPPGRRTEAQFLQAFALAVGG